MDIVQVLCIIMDQDLVAVNKKTEFICLQIKMFMSPSHALIYVSLPRRALITSHALTQNVDTK